jgi:hypothetical protein
MPNISAVRFQKYDRFDNAIFIANPLREPRAFKKLSKYYGQIKDKFQDTFLPIYCSEEHKYASICIRKSNLTRQLAENNVYNVKFALKKRSQDGKIYLNCFVDEIDLICKAPVYDEGDDVDLCDDTDFVASDSRP